MDKHRFNEKDNKNSKCGRRRGYDEIYARATSPEYIRKRIKFNEHGDFQSIERIELGEDGKAQSIERTEYGEKGKAQSIQDIHLGENGKPQHIRFKDIEPRPEREHIKFGENGDFQSIERIELRGDGEIQSIKSINPFERRLELANVLVDKITTYLKDYDIDLLFMEGEKYFTNFKEQFEKFKNSVSEAQQDSNHLAVSQSQLETLFNGVDKIKEFNEAITKASYKDEDDYQPFIEANQDLEKFPIYNNLLTHFGNFQDHITQDEEHLGSLLDTHEINIGDLSQKSQELTEKQDQLDTLFQGVQAIKKFNETIIKAHGKQSELKPFIDNEQTSTVGHKSPSSSREGSLAEGEGKSGGLSVRGSTRPYSGSEEASLGINAKEESYDLDTKPTGIESNLKKFVIYSQLCGQFKYFQECIKQSEKYLASEDPKILDLPQKHQTLAESQSQVESLLQELSRNSFGEYQLKRTVQAAQEKSTTLSEYLTLHKEDVSWLEKSGHLTNFDDRFQAFKDSISKARKYLEGNQLSSEGLLKQIHDLTESQDGTDKVLKVIELKVALTNAERKREEFNQDEFKEQSKKFEMEKYARICLKNFHESISDIQQYFENSQINNEDASEKLIELTEKQIELDKALTIIEFRKKLPTAEAILQHYNGEIPEKVLQKYQECFYEYWSKLEELQEGRKLTESETEDCLKARTEPIERLVKGSYMCMRLKPGRLKGCLKRGRMPSTFDELQIGKSHSTDAKLPEFRIEADRMFIGYPPNLPAELRPLYAFLTRSKDGLHSYRKLKGYGGILVRFKKNVAQRSTVTLDDTGYSTDGLAIVCRPAPYHKPTIHSFPAILARLENDSHKYILDPAKCASIEDIGRYAEAQMHGGLPIDDIEEIIFTSPRHIDDELKSLLEEYKKEYNISYRILEPDQYELNMNWINKHLAVGGSIHPEEIKALGPQGITHVVDTRAERCDDKNMLANENIDWLHLPTPDNHPLSIEDLRKGTEWVNERLKKGECVLIHCEHGVGRSVMLTCAVLITQGMDTNAALDLVKRQRGQANPNPKQIARLREFEAMHRAGELGKGDSQKEYDEEEDEVSEYQPPSKNQPVISQKNPKRVGSGVVLSSTWEPPQTEKN